MRLGTCYSGVEVVKSGVPQGSINDLPGVCDSANFTLFADDAVLAFTGHDYDTMVNEASSSLSLVYDWTVNNRLKLNTTKTSSVLFTNRPAAINPSQINLGDASLSFSCNIKLLGIYIDQNFNFSVNINSLASKLSKISGILYSISGNAP